MTSFRMKFKVQLSYNDLTFVIKVSRYVALTLRGKFNAPNDTSRLSITERRQFLVSFPNKAIYRYFS